MVYLIKEMMANSRRVCKPFCIVNNKLYYSTKQESASFVERRRSVYVIQEIHEGFGETQESKSFRAHHGTAATTSLASKRFY